MPAGGFTFRCSSMYWQGQTYFSPWRPGTRLLRLSLFLTASVPHRPAYRRNRRAPRSCERKDNIEFINASKLKLRFCIQYQIWRLAKSGDIWSVKTATSEPIVAERATSACISGLFVPQYFLNILTRAERLC